MSDTPADLPLENPARISMLMRLGVMLPILCMPAGFIARFAPRVLSPRQAAGFSTSIPVTRAVEIIDRLDTDYLVRTLEWIDPQGMDSLLREVTPATAARIARHLADSRDFADMSSLVGYLSPEAMAACVQVFHNGHDLLKVAGHVTEKHLMAPAILSLPARKLPGLFSAADSAGRWRDIFDIVDAMPHATQDMLGHRLCELESHDLTSFLRASLRLEAWPQLLDICLRLSPQDREMLATMIGEQDETLHLGFMRSARDQGKMQLLLRLVSCMPMHDQRRLVRLAARNGIRITSVL